MRLYDPINGMRQLSGLEWVLALRLAQQYEWQPAGTESPRHGPAAPSAAEEDWHGSYVCPQGQRIRPQDCDNLADALEKGFLEAIYRQQLYLDHDGRDLWSSLIAFLRTAASEQGLALVADEPDTEHPQ